MSQERMIYREMGRGIDRWFESRRAGLFTSVLAALLLHAVLLVYCQPLFVSSASSTPSPAPVMEIFAVAPTPTPIPLPMPEPAQPEPVIQTQAEPVKAAQTDDAAIVKPSSVQPRRTASRQSRSTARQSHSAEPVSSASPIPASAPIKPIMAATPVLVKKPQFLVPPSKPVYPPVAYRRGQQGTVWLEILLSESGKQMQLSVVRSSGFPSLDDAAKVAVADWKLAPYRMNGVAVLSRVQVPVAFVIQ